MIRRGLNFCIAPYHHDFDTFFCLHIKLSWAYTPLIIMNQARFIIDGGIHMKAKATLLAFIPIICLTATLAHADRPEKPIPMSEITLIEENTLSSANNKKELTMNHHERWRREYRRPYEYRPPYPPRYEYRPSPWEYRREWR